MTIRTWQVLRYCTSKNATSPCCFRMSSLFPRQLVYSHRPQVLLLMNICFKLFCEKQLTSQNWPLHPSDESPAIICVRHVLRCCTTCMDNFPIVFHNDQNVFPRQLVFFPQTASCCREAADKKRRTRIFLHAEQT